MFAAANRDTSLGTTGLRCKDVEEGVGFFGFEEYASAPSFEEEYDGHVEGFPFDYYANGPSPTPPAFDTPQKCGQCSAVKLWEEFTVIPGVAIKSENMSSWTETVYTALMGPLCKDCHTEKLQCSCGMCDVCFKDTKFQDADKLCISGVTWPTAFVDDSADIVVCRMCASSSPGSEGHSVLCVKQDPPIQSV